MFVLSNQQKRYLFRTYKHTHTRIHGCMFMRLRACLRRSL